MSKGYFITFEGPDGSGKTTQIALFREYLSQKGYDVVLTREPGGTMISEEIRKIILDPDNKEMDAMTEALLYAASRAQHVAQLIQPSIEAGKIVLSDRFMDSSIAYQGYARGLGDCVRVINEFAVQGCRPDLTFFMQLTPEEGLARAKGREALDRLEMETLSFHKDVYGGYLQLAEIYKQRYVCIDASRPVEEIAETIARRFEEYAAARID